MFKWNLRYFSLCPLLLVPMPGWGLVAVGASVGLILLVILVI